MKTLVLTALLIACLETVLSASVEKKSAEEDVGFDAEEALHEIGTLKAYLMQLQELEEEERRETEGEETEATTRLKRFLVDNRGNLPDDVRTSGPMPCDCSVLRGINDTISRYEEKAELVDRVERNLQIISTTVKYLFSKVANLGQGVEGPPGPHGEIGLPGMMGDQGRPGQDNTMRASGVAGPPGPMGPRGEVGFKGPLGTCTPGRPGRVGDRGGPGVGFPGPRGEPGERGEPGFPARPPGGNTYDTSDTSYSSGVTYNSHTGSGYAGGNQYNSYPSGLPAYEYREPASRRY